MIPQGDLDGSETMQAVSRGTFDIDFPFLRTRLILGLAFLFSGLALMTIDQGSDVFMRLNALAGWIFVIVGSAIAFVSRVITIEPSARRAEVSWKMSGLSVIRKDHDLRGADKVLLGSQQEVVIPEPGLLFVADISYPVTICRQDKVLMYVVGRAVQKTFWGLPIEVSLPSWSFFPSYSRHIAAILATTLNLPLDYRPLNQILAPHDIPAHWLDPNSVQLKLTWRRY